MAKAFGIVNYEGPSVNVKGLEDYRPVSAFFFLGRYRLVDFPLSNMSNSGIDHIKVLMKANPRSLIEHLGTGRHYNINSKRGKLHVLPAASMNNVDFYNNDISSYMHNMQAIEEVNMPYVILAPAHFVYRQDFSALLDAHIESGADVTMLYQKVDNAKKFYLHCDCLNLNKQKGLDGIEKNRGNKEEQNISLETYVMSKDLFIKLVKKAANISSLYWFNDIINDECNELDIRGYEHEGYVACINDFNSYFTANMDLLSYKKVNELFDADWPFYTRTSDSCPTLYHSGIEVTNSMVSNGCVIEGTVINSVIGRGVVVKKGAVVKNSVIFPSVTIGEDVHIENVVVDKLARVVRKKELIGLPDQPLYVKRNDKI